MKNSRYSIRGSMIVDAESNPVPEIYIRELLDVPSAEFGRSKLSPQQKVEVIQALGLDALIQVLGDCYRQNMKGYDAGREAEFAVMMLKKVLEQ